MNYILKSQLLPINYKPHANKDALYIQWIAKQQLQKQLEQKYKLQKMLDGIIQQQKEGTNHSQHRRKDFYSYTVQWKNNVEQRIQRQKDQLDKMKKEQQQAQITQKRQTNKFAQFNSIKQHVGPIKGWNEHFNLYMLKKQQNYLQNEFHFNPQINKKSNMIAGVSPYPVEQRLIRYGQLCKIKKQQALQHQSRTDNNSKNSKSRNGINNSNLFYRLYKEADRINRVKKQNQLSAAYSFKPQLNELSQQMNEKVQANRKPLYHIKDHSNINTNIKINNQKAKKVNFNQFIKRNEALLEKRNKRQVNKVQCDKQKEEQNQKMCTFSPKINKQSLKIFKDRIYTQQNGLQNRMSFLLNRHRNLDLIQQDKQQHQNIAVQYQNKAVQSVKNQHQSNYLNPNMSDGMFIQFTSRTIKSHSQIKKNDINESESWIQQSSAKVITEKIEQDSIEKMRASQWETQLQQVQNQIEEMMKRTFYR